jgi:T1SS-143 domain-containing protein
LNGNDQSLGNPGAGDTLADDQASGAIGSLTGLMSVGADEPPTISLSSVTTSLPALFSKGDAVSYSVVDSNDADTLLDTLTATAGGRTVFTLKVNPDGSWAFDLDDQLDHVAGGGENTVLRTAADGTTSVASIDFSSIVQVTDADGDTVAPLLAGDFAITVEDDIPVRAASPAPVTATVEEDGMSAAVTPEASGLNGNDQSEGNRASSGDGVGRTKATGAIGSLTALMSVGADEPPRSA